MVRNEDRNVPKGPVLLYRFADEIAWDTDGVEVLVLRPFRARFAVKAGSVGIEDLNDGREPIQTAQAEANDLTRIRGGGGHDEEVGVSPLRAADRRRVRGKRHRLFEPVTDVAISRVDARHRRRRGGRRRWRLRRIGRRRRLGRRRVIHDTRRWRRGRRRHVDPRRRGADDDGAARPHADRARRGRHGGGCGSEAGQCDGQSVTHDALLNGG